MKQRKYISVGGLVGMGFDATAQFLLTVSHSGRGVFAVNTWERVARNPELAYPEDGKAVGIGPIAGEVITVAEMDKNERIALISPNGRIHLLYESGCITIEEEGTEHAGGA